MSAIAIRALKDKLARTKGELETAEQAVEDMHGLDAIMDAWRQIDERKKVLRKAIYHLVAVIQLWEPEFTPIAVAPIQPRVREYGNGTISQEAYAVLRDADRPLKTREVSRLVAARLGRDLDERGVARLDIAISAAFASKLDRGLIAVSATQPKKWRLGSALTGEQADA